MLPVNETGDSKAFGNKDVVRLKVGMAENGGIASRGRGYETWSKLEVVISDVACSSRFYFL